LDEIKILKKKLKNRDEFLISSIEIYDCYRNNEELIENLRLLLKK